jgi:hypothetical protein
MPLSTFQRGFAMPARGTYHDTVRNALIKDGWTITHDPLHIKWGKKDLFIDLGAEQLLAAEKGERKIAVEIKSFQGPSDIADLEQALGQYTLYYDLLAEAEPERCLYLAVPRNVLEDVFEGPVGQLLLQKQRLRLIVFDPQQEALFRWIP